MESSRYKSRFLYNGIKRSCAHWSWHLPTCWPHEFMCVPKGSCTSFYISAPNVTVTKENRTFPLCLDPVYSLTMDNVAYRKVDYDYRPDGSNNNKTTNMGKCTVAVGGLCDVQTQDLFVFDLELRMPVKLKHAMLCILWA